MRKLSNKYNVPIATLHRYLNHQKEEKQFLKKISERGRKTVFTAVEERQLTNCIIELARIGFAPSLNEIGDVRSYVEYNDHERGKKSFHYKSVLGYPGPDWMRNFLKRNKLPLK